MGGPGSGRWPRNYKRREVVQSCSSLSIIAMRRGGALVPQKETNGTLFRRDQITQEVDFSIKFRVTWRSPDGPRLWLAYELPGSAERVRYSIQLACTRTNWGGTRFWFVCPLIGSSGPCGRRAGKLYRPAECKQFGCRVCYQLSYRSVHEHEKRAASRRRDAALQKIQTRAARP
jgi:hypothetical protein